MSILDRVLKAFSSVEGIKQKGDDFETLSQYALAGMLKNNSSTAEGVGYVFSAIDVWGKHFAKAKFRLYERLPKGGVKERYSHGFLNLLNNKGSELTNWEMLYSLGFNWGLNGVQYLHKLRNAFGVAVQYELLMSNRMSITKIDGKIVYSYSTEEGMTKKMNREDLIIIRYPNNKSQYMPTPIANNFANQIQIDLMQTMYQQKFLEEGGFLGAVFTTNKDLDDRAFQRAKAELLANYSGRSNSFKMGLFDGGLSPIKAAYSPKDLDLATQKAFTRDEVLSAFQVPKTLLGFGDSINRNTAEATFYAFSTGVIDPLLSFIDEILTKELQLEYNSPNLYIKHDSLAPADVQGQVKYYTEMQKSGNMTINEARAEEGLDPLPYDLCNKPLMNVGGTVIDLSRPVDEQMQNAKPETKPKPTDTNNDNNNDENTTGDSNV